MWRTIRTQKMATVSIYIRVYIRTYESRHKSDTQALLCTSVTLATWPWCGRNREVGLFTNGPTKYVVTEERVCPRVMSCDRRTLPAVLLSFYLSPSGARRTRYPFTRSPPGRECGVRPTMRRVNSSNGKTDGDDDSGNDGSDGAECRQ